MISILCAIASYVYNYTAVSEPGLHCVDCKRQFEKCVLVKRYIKTRMMSVRMGYDVRKIFYAYHESGIFLNTATDRKTDGFAESCIRILVVFTGELFNVKRSCKEFEEYFVKFHLFRRCIPVHFGVHSQVFTDFFF